MLPSQQHVVSCVKVVEPIVGGGSRLVSSDLLHFFFFWVMYRER